MKHILYFLPKGGKLPLGLSLSDNNIQLSNVVFSFSSRRITIECERKYIDKIVEKLKSYVIVDHGVDGNQVIISGIDYAYISEK